MRFLSLTHSLGKAVSFVEICVAHVSILTMLAISFERFYAICRPLEAGYKCTKRRAFLIILLIWIIALASVLPMLWITELQVRIIIPVFVYHSLYAMLCSWLRFARLMLASHEDPLEERSARAATALSIYLHQKPCCLVLT